MILDKIKNVIISDVNELNYNDKCLISGNNLDSYEINKNNVIKLRCGHSFKYNYFLKSIRVMYHNSYGYNKCPYCFTNIGRIPLILTRTKLDKIAIKIKKRVMKKEMKK